MSELPLGLAPITIGPRALSAIKEREHPVRSWYLDLTLLLKYWGQERVYHHTAPISLNFTLHEALRLIVEEVLDVCFKRHVLNHSALVVGLEALGGVDPVTWTPLCYMKGVRDAENTSCISRGISTKDS